MRFGVAIVLTDKLGTILYVNRPAERVLRDGGPIRRAGGILQAATPSARMASYALPSALAARNEAGIGKIWLALRLTPAPESPHRGEIAAGSSQLDAFTRTLSPPIASIAIVASSGY
jgi:hypothetical protein